MDKAKKIELARLIIYFLLYTATIGLNAYHIGKIDANLKLLRTAELSDIEILKCYNVLNKKDE